jgi:8-oxo-dGTP pyrophosphatase MutT (NUDIX family)
VTVAAVVEREGRFLLVEENTTTGLRWNQPAGHLEPGESLIQAVAREALEETGRLFQPQGLLATYLAPAGETAYLRFAFVGAVGEPLAGRELDDGIVRAFWADAATIREHAHLHRSPAVMRSVDDYLAARAAGRSWTPLAAVAYLEAGV